MFPPHDQLKLDAGAGGDLVEMSHFIQHRQPREQKKTSFRTAMSDAMEDARKLAEEGASLGDQYTAIALSLWKSCKVDCTLHHAVRSSGSWCVEGDPFLVVHTVGDPGREQLIGTDGSEALVRSHVTVVDLTFKERYSLVRCTQTYSDYMESSVSDVFVGTFRELLYTVGEIAEQMAESFQETTHDLPPPWRSVEAVRLSYWYRDTSKVKQDKMARLMMMAGTH